MSPPPAISRQFADYRIPQLPLLRRPNASVVRRLIPTCAAALGGATIVHCRSRFPRWWSVARVSICSRPTKQAGSPLLCSTNDGRERLKRYGVAGVLSYGLLNTVYYLTTFLLVWFYFAPAPGRMGYATAVERFIKVMAMVWAGSQVTKLIRAGGALALAPVVDRGLSWFTVKFNFESKGKAFAAIAGMCFGLALLLFLVLTLLWA